MEPGLGGGVGMCVRGKDCRLIVMASWSTRGLKVEGSGNVTPPYQIFFFPSKKIREEKIKEENNIG